MASPWIGIWCICKTRIAFSPCRGVAFLELKMKNGNDTSILEPQDKPYPGFYADAEYGDRLLIHFDADTREVERNIIVARAILESFPQTSVIIRAHRLEYGVKNPEYEIDGLLADRKGIKSEKGIKWGFISAIKQGCKAVVIDLDDRMRQVPLRVKTVAKMIQWRHRDFEQGILQKCYVIRHDRAIVIESIHFETSSIIGTIEKLKP